MMRAWLWMRFTRLWLVRGCSDRGGEIRQGVWMGGGRGRGSGRNALRCVRGNAFPEVPFHFTGTAASMISFQESRCFNPHLNV
jgi:hypothetical protein